MKMEQTECSETSAYKIQTPGNYPEESLLRDHCLFVKLKRHCFFDQQFIDELIPVHSFMFQRNRAVRTAKCEILPRFFSRDVHSM
jgi:hypothetical protein